MPHHLFLFHSAYLCSLCSQAQLRQYLLQVVFLEDPSSPLVPSTLSLGHISFALLMAASSWVASIWKSHSHHRLTLCQSSSTSPLVKTSEISCTTPYFVGQIPLLQKIPATTTEDFTYLDFLRLYYKNKSLFSKYKIISTLIIVFQYTPTCPHSRVWALYGIQQPSTH